MTGSSDGKRDFFLSFNQADRAWATWIAWVLEEAGYSVFFQDWDFKGNFVEHMNRAHTQAHRTLAVLSDHYFGSDFTLAEWSARFAQDPAAREDRLVPVKVGPLTSETILGPIVYADLLGCEEAEAQQRLLGRVKKSVDADYRDKPRSRPGFPGGPPRLVPAKPSFPVAERQTTASRNGEDPAPAPARPTVSADRGGVAGGGSVSVRTSHGLSGLWVVLLALILIGGAGLLVYILSDNRTPPITIYMPPDQVQALVTAFTRESEVAAEARTEAEIKAARLATKLGFTQQAVIGFLRILGEQEVPPEQMPTKLGEIATRYKDLLAQLKTTDSPDPEVNRLKKEAAEALHAGNFARTEELLNQAKARDLVAVEQMQADLEARKLSARWWQCLGADVEQMQADLEARKLSAAGAAAENGDLMMTQLRYADAARYYAEAVGLTPEKYAEQRSKHLTDLDIAARLGGKGKVRAQNQEHTNLNGIWVQEEPHKGREVTIAQTGSTVTITYDPEQRCPRGRREKIIFEQVTLTGSTLVGKLGTCRRLGGDPLTDANDKWVGTLLMVDIKLTVSEDGNSMDGALFLAGTGYKIVNIRFIRKSRS